MQNFVFVPIENWRESGRAAATVEEQRFNSEGTDSKDINL